MFRAYRSSIVRRTAENDPKTGSYYLLSYTYTYHCDGRRKSESIYSGIDRRDNQYRLLIIHLDVHLARRYVFISGVHFVCVLHDPFVVARGEEGGNRHCFPYGPSDVRVRDRKSIRA